SSGIAPPSGSRRRIAATSSTCARSSISAFSSLSRAARYFAPSPGNRTRWTVALFRALFVFRFISDLHASAPLGNDHLSRKLSGKRAGIPHDHAVHDRVHDSFCQLVRILVSRRIADLRGVENE